VVAFPTIRALCAGNTCSRLRLKSHIPAYLAEITRLLKEIKMFSKEQQVQYDQQTDEVKICCQWLDAQIRTRSIRQIYASKQLIENWAGSYISSEDFITALVLLVSYQPTFNIF